MENNMKEKKEENKNEIECGGDETVLEKRLLFLPRKKLVILFLFGLVLGIFLKNNILKDYVIGFEDYRLENLKSDYDFKMPAPAVAGEQGEAPAVEAEPQPSCN